MKTIITFILLIMVSFGTANISTKTEKNNQITSPANSEYTFIKQDGYIDLGYDSVDKNRALVSTRSSANMVNFDMDTRSQSFETFDPNSYYQRNNTPSTRRLSGSEKESLMTIYSETIEGEECLYTEGYSPNVENPSNSNLSLISTDPNDNRKPVSNPKISPYSSIGRTVAKYYNVKSNINGAYYTILSSGTGFLEGPNIIATAAHCTYGDVTVDDFDDGKNNPRFPDILEF